MIPTVAVSPVGLSTCAAVTGAAGVAPPPGTTPAGPFACTVTVPGRPSVPRVTGAIPTAVSPAGPFTCTITVPGRPSVPGVISVVSVR